MQLTTKNAAVLSCLVPRARAVHVIACRLARWALQYVCRIMSAKSPVEFHAQGLKLIWRQKYAFVAGVGISGPYGRLCPHVIHHRMARDTCYPREHSSFSHTQCVRCSMQDKNIASCILFEACHAPTGQSHVLKLGTCDVMDRLTMMRKKIPVQLDFRVS